MVATGRVKFALGQRTTRPNRFTPRQWTEFVLELLKNLELKNLRGFSPLLNLVKDDQQHDGRSYVVVDESVIHAETDARGVRRDIQFLKVAHLRYWPTALEDHIVTQKLALDRKGSLYALSAHWTQGDLTTDCKAPFGFRYDLVEIRIQKLSEADLIGIFASEEGEDKDTTIWQMLYLLRNAHLETAARLRELELKVREKAWFLGGCAQRFGSILPPPPSR